MWPRILEFRVGNDCQTHELSGIVESRHARYVYLLYKVGK